MYTQNALYDYIFYIDSILDILYNVYIHIYTTHTTIYTMYTVSIYSILINTLYVV